MAEFKKGPKLVLQFQVQPKESVSECKCRWWVVMKKRWKGERRDER
jgi:hypothetical protein